VAWQDLPVFSTAPFARKDNMMEHCKIAESTERLRLLEFARLNPVATASEASFDLITRLVQQSLGVPAVAITLIDRDTQYLKARQGVAISTTPRCEAVCDIVVCSGKPLVIEDMQKDDRVVDNPAVLGPNGLRAYAGAPLTTRAGQHLGALCVLDTAPRSFSAEQIKLLTGFAALVSDQLELRAQADRDFLTNTLNRRGFETVLHREMGWIAGGGPSATLAMLDLDHFKKVNDTYGHPVGDTVLRALATLISGQIRKVDYLARLGGEEFAVLLPDTPIEDGMKVVNRIHESVAAFRLADFPDLTLTVSIGLIDITRRNKDAVAVMHDVDAAVYAAKANGRNRTITFPNGHPFRTAQVVDRRASGDKPAS